MATTLSTAMMKIIMNATLASDPANGTATQVIPYTKTLNFADGAGANQINTVWQDTREIEASGTDDLDLAGGLTDAFGNTLTLTKLKGIIVYAAPGNTNDVLVGGDASAAFASLFGDASDVIVLPPGAWFAACNPSAAGYAVTATTGDILQIANSAGSTVVNYDIVLFGSE